MTEGRWSRLNQRPFQSCQLFLPPTSRQSSLAEFVRKKPEFRQILSLFPADTPLVSFCKTDPNSINVDDEELREKAVLAIHTARAGMFKPAVSGKYILPAVSFFVVTVLSSVLVLLIFFQVHFTIIAPPFTQPWTSIHEFKGLGKHRRLTWALNKHTLKHFLHLSRANFAA